MEIKENLLQRIHESEDCPICMNIMEIEDKVYTEPCYHVYCTWCLGKWCADNTTCPMDRINIRKIHVYNPIEAEIKVVGIKHVKRKYIFRVRQNEIKEMTGEKVRILMGIYNYVISLSNSLEEIYEIFTEGSFQILLNMDPNYSKRGFGVFKQSICSAKSELDLKMQDFNVTILGNRQMIDRKIWQIECNMREYDDNGELVGYLKDLELLNKINEMLGRINEELDIVKNLFCNILFLNDHVELRRFYEKVKIKISHYKEIILLNLNHAKSLILQLSKQSENIEYLDLFANTPESCLLCRNNKKEDLVCRFDKCHHKNCEEMFDLRNIICPIENQLMGSRLISNPVDVEEILKR